MPKDSFLILPFLWREKTIEVSNSNGYPKSSKSGITTKKHADFLGIEIYHDLGIPQRSENNVHSFLPFVKWAMNCSSVGLKLRGPRAQRRSMAQEMALISGNGCYNSRFRRSHGPVEKLCSVFVLLEWWIFPFRYVAVYQTVTS